MLMTVLPTIDLTTASVVTVFCGESRATKFPRNTYNQMLFALGPSDGQKNAYTVHG
jgi:hypothetical protein